LKNLVWSSTFIRIFKRLTNRDKDLKKKTEITLRKLIENPFDPTLHSHKLKGGLTGVWACTIDYDNRILFEFVRNSENNEEEIYLLTMGKHDEVY
jgi:addiction module RelE/StbE family toxin